MKNWKNEEEFLEFIEQGRRELRLKYGLDELARIHEGSPVYWETTKDGYGLDEFGNIIRVDKKDE